MKQSIKDLQMREHMDFMVSKIHEAII